MKLNITLRRRLERVEKRLGERKPLPKVFMGVYLAEQPGPIYGFAGGGKLVRLKAGETLCELRARAAAEIPARILRTLYGPARAALGASAVPPAVPTPLNRPVEPSRAVPGVGRAASREELVKMGALAVPPERLI